MPEDLTGRPKTLQRLWEFVKRQAVDDVPKEIAICEFDCNRAQCRQNEWDVCGRRIHHGSGELFPDARLRNSGPGDSGR
ncbi:MAG: hypothetical protein WDO73_11260 [Ignavibacteriota bacterium]